jgi:hypothetical protein
MRRNIEIWTIVIGIVVLTLTVLGCIHYRHDPEKVIKIAAAGFAIIFFAYKLLTGWLFINLNMELEGKRTTLDQERDHIVLHIMLDKGSIDSFWLKDIDIRVSELDYQQGSVRIHTICTLKPHGTAKTVTNGDTPDWDGEKFEYYVLSPNEKTCFAAYLTVGSRQVVLLEVMILGTRPFYGIEYKKGKPIQWRASTILLPEQVLPR